MNNKIECPYCFKLLKNDLGLKMHLVKNIDCIPIESYASELSLEKRNELAANKLKLIQRNLGELRRRIDWDNRYWAKEDSILGILKQIRDVLKLIEIKGKGK